MLHESLIQGRLPRFGGGRWYVDEVRISLRFWALLLAIMILSRISYFQFFLSIGSLRF